MVICSGESPFLTLGGGDNHVCQIRRIELPQEVQWVLLGGSLIIARCRASEKGITHHMDFDSERVKYENYIRILSYFPFQNFDTAFKTSFLNRTVLDLILSLCAAKFISIAWRSSDRQGLSGCIVTTIPQLSFCDLFIWNEIKDFVFIIIPKTVREPSIGT